RLLPYAETRHAREHDRRAGGDTPAAEASLSRSAARLDHYGRGRAHDRARGTDQAVHHCRRGVAGPHMTIGLELTRSQILAFRRRAASLDERLPRGQGALRRAAWAGLQDSMPRAALLSIHARMAGTEHETWEDPSLIQIWGPRFSAYVVAKCDLAVFTLGRLPDEPGPRKRAQDIAARLQSALAGRRMTYVAAARAMGAK